MSVNKEVIRKWVDELRSGDYDQGREGYLYREGKYCCLGVLCDLAYKENAVNIKEDDDLRYYGSEEDGWNLSTLPESVQKWAGFYTESPRTKQYSLIFYNDSHYSFEEIADLIEEEWLND